MDQEGLHDNNEINRAHHVSPSLLRINADNQNKRNLCIFWSVFFFVLILIGALTAAVPRSILSLTNSSELGGTSLQFCKNPSQFSDKGVLMCDQANYNKVGVVLRHLHQGNQFALMVLHFIVVNSSQPIDINATVKLDIIQLHQTTLNDSVAFIQGKSFTIDHQLQLHSNQAIQHWDDNYQNLLGYTIPAYAIRELNSSTYGFFINFQSSVVNFKNVKPPLEIEVFVVNPSFTTFTIVIRYVYFAIAIVAAVLYILHYCFIPPSQRIVEQKIIAVLSLMLIMFNDPFYPLTIFSPNFASSFFSVFFVVDFVIVLLFFWIVILDRIHYENGQKKTQLALWKRALYIAITYVFVLTLYILYAFDNLEGTPIIPTHDLYASQRFQALQIIVILIVIAGFLYIFLRYVQSCSSTDEKLWRNQLFLFFSVFFLFVTVVLFIIGGLQINDYSESRILILYSEMNFYIYYLQYMFRVTPEEVERIKRGQFNTVRYLIESKDDLEPEMSESKDILDLKRQPEGENEETFKELEENKHNEFFSEEQKTQKEQQES